MDPCSEPRDRLFRDNPELTPFLLTNVRLTGSRIGAGAYGCVEEVAIPGAICAAKMIHDFFQDTSQIPPVAIRKVSEQFVRECKLMSTLRHPHIVQFLGLCYFPGSYLPAIVMERLMTSLHDLLDPEIDPPPPPHSPKPFFPLDLKFSILHNVASGLAYLHNQSPPIIHRDLSARNVLLNSAMIAKIADLGVARIIPRLRPAATMTKAPGAGIYMPPEALEEKSGDDEETKSKYDASIDVFSFGVVSIFSICQTFPCKLLAPTYRESHKLIARSELERRERYMRMIYSQLHEDHPLIKMIKKCLSFPEDRPSIHEVLEQLNVARGESSDEHSDMSKLLFLQALQAHKEVELELQSHVEEALQQLQLRNQENVALWQQLQSSEKEKQLILQQNEAEKNRGEEDIKRGQQQLQETREQETALVEIKDKELAQTHKQLREKDELIYRQQQELREKKEQLRSSETLVAEFKKSLQQRDLELDTLRSMSQKSLLSMQHDPDPYINTKNGSLRQLTLQCCEKKTAPCVMHRGSSTANRQFAYFVPNGSHSVYRYDAVTEKWVQLTPCPYCNSALVIIDGELTTVGGQVGSRFTNKLFTLNQGKWVEEYPAMNVACSHSAVVSSLQGDHVIVIGGCGAGGAWIPTVRLLQVKSRTWCILTDLPQSLVLPSAAICGNKLHVISGWVGQYDGYSCSLINDQHLQSSPSTLSWKPLPRLPVTNSTAATLGGQLVIIGGFRDGLLVNCIYQLVDGDWLKVGSMSSGRWWCLAVGQISDKIMIVGGRGDGITKLDCVEECSVMDCF